MHKKIISTIALGLIIGASTISANANPKLSDVDGHWANKEIQQFISNGFINGYEDGTFKPDNSITRAEFVKILNKTFKLRNGNGVVFNDTVNHWAKNEIDIAVTNGVCRGTSATTFEPDAPITREQAAKMIANYKRITDTYHNKINNYGDGWVVSSWAKDAVESILEAGYMNGYGEDNTFRPLNNITRAEAVVTLGRVENNPNPVIPNPPVDGTVYANGGSSSSNKYHKSANAHGMKGAIAMSESQAKSKGYIPCDSCFR